MTGRWRVALRVARRTARRSPGRTVLVAALVAAPVLGTTFLDTAFRTADLTPATEVAREMGTADAALTVTSFAQVRSLGTGWDPGESARERDPATVRPRDLLPAGTRLLPRRPDGSVTFAAADKITVAASAELPWTDPLAAGLLALRSGRLAAGPGEVTLSPTLADRLGVGVGDTVTPSGGTAQRVVGLAVRPSCRSCQVAAGPPGWTGTADGPRSDDYLVDLPDGTVADPALQDRLAAAGVFLLPRDARLHPERWEDQAYAAGGDNETLAIIVLVAGIGMLEVVLLAGTAFAVAARRQVRDAALVLANGGRRSDVRRMLLAQGAVLGVLGSAAGVLLGLVAVLAVWSPLQRLVDQDFGGLVVSPRDLAVAALVGTLAGVAAAVVPAWGASRVPVVAALAGRQAWPAGARQKVATGAVVATVGGLVLAAVVAGAWAAARRVDGGGGSLGYPLGLLAGFGLAMVGLTVLAPTLVGLAGRLGGRLSLTARLALRDAARHRHRTGPAVGAVMVAVAGSVAVAFAVAAYDQRDREGYAPDLPIGWASSFLSTGPESGGLAAQTAAVRLAATELPTEAVVPMSYAVLPGRPDTYGSWRVDPDCARPNLSVGVGDATARLVAGARGDEAAAALAAGKAVVTDPCMARGGTATVDVSDGLSERPLKTLTLPAVVLPAVPGTLLPGGVIGDAVATRAGIGSDATALVVRTSRVPTEAEEDRARAVLGPQGPGLRIERGYGAPYLPGFVALMGGAGLVTLAGVAISVSLSAAEGRADLATLAAIGAPPRRRRGLAMVQAALVAGLGVGLGLLLGAAVGVTIMSGLDGYPLVVPWPTVLVLGLGVPALGVLAAGLLTRSRLPMVRRLG